MTKVWRRAGSVLAVCLCSIAFVAPAQAAKSHRVTGGHTTIGASSAIVHFIAFLRSQGITVTAISPAKFAHGSLTLPIVGGSMTLPSMHGVMTTSGGLKFKKGKRVLRVRDYRVSHKRGGATLSAVVSSTRLSPRRVVIAHMASMKTHMSGKTGTMSGGLAITATWASLVNQLIGKKVLKAGDDLGDMSAKV